MPNWCNSIIKFIPYSEGFDSVKDFHSKLTSLLESKGSKDLFEVDIEKSFNLDIQNTYKRGYVYAISEIDKDGSFYICVDDAWSPNIEWWYYLITTLYGENIDITYSSCEPGCGLYHTNDNGLLPYYDISIYAEADNLLKLDKLWNWNNPLFPKLLLLQYCYNIGNRTLPINSGFHCVPYVDNHYEGDNSDTVTFLNEFVTCDKISDIEEKHMDDIIKIDQYQYVDVGEYLTNDVKIETISK